MNPFDASLLFSLHGAASWLGVLCLGVLCRGVLVVLGLVAARLRRCRRQDLPAQDRELEAHGRSLCIGPYALVGRIGEGAMGEVYRARHSRSGQLRALKLLAPRASQQQRARFEHEARLGVQFRHPNTVAALEHGRAPDGRPYFTMDLVEGADLDALVAREGPQPAERVIDILRQVAAALEELHERGFVHRDIKPANILVCRGAHGDAVKLIDFGLAKHVAEPASVEDCVVGTPLYISPDAILAPNDVDGRSDLYGLGAVAYFLLSGAPVFVGKSPIDVCTQHLLRAPEPLSRACRAPIDAPLERLVLDCLAKDPAARPRDARELIRRLDGCSADSASRATPRWSRAA